MSKSATKPRRTVRIRDSIQGVTNPAIHRMALKAGVKKISSECYDEVRAYVEYLVKETVKESLVYTKSAGRKTIMSKDIINAIESQGHHYAFSNALVKTRKCTAPKRRPKKTATRKPRTKRTA